MSPDEPFTARPVTGVLRLRAETTTFATHRSFRRVIFDDPANSLAREHITIGRVDRSKIDATERRSDRILEAPVALSTFSRSSKTCCEEEPRGWPRADGDLARSAGNREVRGVISRHGRIARGDKLVDNFLPRGYIDGAR